MSPVKPRGPQVGMKRLRVFFLSRSMTRYSNLVLLSLYFLAGICIGVYGYDLKVRTCMDFRHAANWYCRF